MTIAWYAVLAVIALVPVATTNLAVVGIPARLTASQFDLIKMVIERCAALIGLAGVVWHLATRGGRLRYTPVDAVFAAFVGWVAVSSVFSIHVPTALFGSQGRYEGLFSFMTYLALYAVVLQVAQRGSRIMTMARVFFWSSGLVGLYGVAQFVGIDPAEWTALGFESNRAFATYGNPDLLAGLLCFSLFVSLGLALAEKRLSWRITYGVGFAIAAVALVGTFVRGAWIGALVGLIAFVVFAWRVRVRPLPVDWAWAGTAAAAVAAAVFSSLSSPSEVTNVAARLASITQTSEGSALTRFQIWKAAVASIQEHPLFGSGADTFRMVFARYKPAEYVRATGHLSTADNAHNYPLHLASGIGVPGVLLLYAGFAWAAARAAKMLWGQRDSETTLVLIGIWAACAAYLTHLMFGLSVVGVTVFLWIGIALLLSPTARSMEIAAPSWGRWAAYAAVALAAAGCVFHLTMLSADASYLEAQRSAGAPRIEAARAAARLAPYNDAYRAEADWSYAEAFFEAAGAYGQAVGTAQEAAAKSRLTDAFLLAESALNQTADTVPGGTENHYARLANVYVVAASVLGEEYAVKAEQAARAGVLAEPAGPEPRFMLAYALQLQGKSDEAIDAAREALALDPGYTEVATYLAQLLSDAGRTKEAIDVLRVTAARVPGDTTVTQALRALEASAAVPATATP